MGQTADELKSALKLAAKAAPGKPHFYAMVFKGGAEGTLIVDKRKIASKLVDAAKKEFNTTTVVRGVCYGAEDMLVFETPRPPAGNLDSVAKRLAQLRCGLAIKPEFRLGRDESQMGDEDEAPESQSVTPVTSGGASPDDLARKAYDGLLARLQPLVKAARDGKSPALAKIGSLLEFAVGKASAGDHRAAVQALQSLQALLANEPESSTAKPGTTTTTTPSSGKKPGTTTRERGPVEPEAARDFIAKVNPAEEEQDTVETATAGLLDDLKTRLKTAKRLVTVDDIDALAAAMARERGIDVGAARQMIDNNQGRGFTAPNGTVYVLGNTPQAAHDEVHETVHLMSAPGGATKIMAKYGEQLNEACTEYFTKQMCRRLNVPDADAYVEHVAFMNRLAPVVGYDTLYTAYMKNGGFEPVVEKLTDIWIRKSDRLPGPQKPPNVKGVINREKTVTAIDNRFLNNFPPAGAALKFWDVVFFA